MEPPNPVPCSLFPPSSFSLKQGPRVLSIMPLVIPKNLCLEAVGPRTPDVATFRLFSIPELRLPCSSGEQKWRQSLGYEVHSQMSTFCHDCSIALKARYLGSSGPVFRAGSRSGQTLALSLWCPLSGREEKELSDHSQV